MSEPDPRDIVEEFFERRGDPEKEDTITELFSEETVITAPGRKYIGADAAQEFVDSIPSRFEWVDKRFDRWIEVGNEIVSIGRLYGVDTDGNSFSDVRYVDVYTLEDGEITRLEIWNDIAAEGTLDQEESDE